MSFRKLGIVGALLLAAACSGPSSTNDVTGRALCSVNDIRGERLSRINGRGACGISSPVLVRSVSGITLSPPATMDCRTAKALNSWTKRSAISAFRSLGGLESMRVWDSYN